MLVKLQMSNKLLQLGTVKFMTSPFTTAPGQRSALTTGAGNTSLAINWDEVTCKGLVHMPDLHEILRRHILNYVMCTSIIHQRLRQHGCSKLAENKYHKVKYLDKGTMFFSIIKLLVAKNHNFKEWKCIVQDIGTWKEYITNIR